MRTLSATLAVLCLTGGAALADDGAPVPPPPAPAGAAAGDGFMFGPLVTPEQGLELHGGVPIFFSKSGVDAMGNQTTQNSEFISVGGNFGVIPKLEIGGDFSINLHPSDSHQIFIELHGAYEILPSSERLSLGLAGALGINRDSGPDGMGGTRANTDFNLQLGAWLRFAITRQLALFTGRTPGPYAIAGLSSYILPPMRQQLDIGLTSGSPIVLDVPVALWYQPTPQVALGLSVDVMRLGFSNASNTILFKDGIPVALSLNFAGTEQLILGIDIIDDLKSPGDFYAFVLKAGFRVK